MATKMSQTTESTNKCKNPVNALRLLAEPKTLLEWLVHMCRMLV